jgi:hypothetical protein
MAKPLTLDDLPDDLARFAKAQLATGQFSSVEDILRATAAAFIEREAEPLPHIEDEPAFIAAVQEGQAQIVRGESICHEDAMTRAEARLAEHSRRRPQ